MADVITNLKVRFGADTKQFQKGMDEGTKATKQFKEDAGNALDSFAAAFGVNMSEIRNGINSMKASLLGVNAGFKAAAAGTGFLTKAMQILKVALISTGIGALIVALGTLASYFTKTERGAEQVERVMAGIKAVFTVLIDRASKFGEGLFKIFTGDFKGGWDALKESVSGVGAEIVNEARAATELERRLQALEDREIALIEIQSEREKRIAEARRLATEEGVDARIKAKAIKEAFELEKQTLEENKSMQRERVAIMQEQINMSETMDSELRALNEEKAKLNQLDTESSMAQKTLQRDLKRVNNEIAAQTAAIIEQQEAVREASLESLKGFDKPLESKGMEIGVSLSTDLEFGKLAENLKTGLEPAKDIILDFTDFFNGAMEDIASSFAEGVGDLLAGTSGLSDFGNQMLSTLGGLMAKVGKMIMSAGIAFFALGQAFKKAITNPATALLAVAAGAALIAVGKAVQGSIASAASGGGGTFSGNTAGNGGTFDTRTVQAAPVRAQVEPIQVVVSGEFRQRGSDMVATIAETQTRRSYNR